MAEWRRVKALVSVDEGCFAFMEKAWTKARNGSMAASAKFVSNSAGGPGCYQGGGRFAGCSRPASWRW